MSPSLASPSRVLLLLLAIALGAVGAGCGSSGPSSDASDASDAVDAGDASEARHEPDAPAEGLDAATDAGTDTEADAAQDAVIEHAPVACGAGTACNERLSDERLCAGACVPAGTGLSCGGEVSHGLCFGRAPVRFSDEVEGGAFVVSVRAKPEEARVGDAFAVTFEVKNVSAGVADARVGVKPGAAASLIDTGDFDPTEPLTLAAGASRTITANLKAETATILDPGNWSVLDVSIAGTPLDPRGLRVAVPIAFAAGPRACGGRVYPDFNTVEGQNYGSARCCGGVFYPGAHCCADADCGGGTGGARCADGICVLAAPHISYAGSPLAGPQRVLIVFVDEPEPKPDAPRAAPTDVCTDLSAARGADLRLPLIAGWFADVARARVGRVLTDFRFTVLAGLKTQDFAPTNDSPPTYGAALEAFLMARGCTAGWGRDYDRVVIVSPRVQTGAHQGLVYATDRVAQQYWSASIATHELAHTFGATDRYFDVGGTLQYGGALMSTVDRDPADLLDTVFWAESGLGDVDRDGVIDALAYARAPDLLVVKELSVEANKNNRSLLVNVRVGAREGGRSLVVVPREVRVELVGAGASAVMDIDGHRPGVAPADRDRYATVLRAGDEITGAAFDDIVAAKKVKARVRIDHAFTTATFARQTASLDETRELVVPVVGNGNPGPLP